MLNLTELIDQIDEYRFLVSERRQMKSALDSGVNIHIHNVTFGTTFQTGDITIQRSANEAEYDCIKASLLRAMTKKIVTVCDKLKEAGVDPNT